MVKKNTTQRDPKDTTLTRTSWKLVNYLKSNAKYGESLEDVIWKLLGVQKR